MEQYESIIKEWLEKDYDTVQMVHEPYFCAICRLNELDETHIATFNYYESDDHLKSIRVLGSTDNHGWEIGIIYL